MKKLLTSCWHLPERFFFQLALSWHNTGILIVENAEICVRIAAIFVLIQEICERIDAICGQMVVSVSEIFLSSEKTDTKERHEENCAVTGGTSGAIHVTFGKTVAI
jgi:hypothetical protein